MPQLAETDFDTFLSHNSRDKGPARELKRKLESREITVWFDEDQLRPGLPWQPLIQQGIECAGSVIVAIGSAGIGAWHDEETQAALVVAHRSQRPVIPVLLPGGPEPDGLSLFLQNRTWVDLRSGFDDERISGLIWGITGRKPAGTGALIEQPAKAIRWVLVAGSGGMTPRPQKMEETCTIIGTELAKAGFGLVTGGWDGVDHYVARAFSQEIQKDDAPLSTRLVQVMQEGSTPEFPAGRLHLRKSDEEAWRHSIERADAVLLVGGMGGTYQTGKWALQSGKPVLPLADTRGSLGLHADAYRFYFDTLQRWELNPASKKLTREQFEDLAGAAPRVGRTAVRLLRTVLP